MNKSTLREVSELITKGTTPSSIGHEFVSDGINFIKSESITDSKYLNNLIYEHIDEETDKKLKRSRIKDGDLLFSIAGAYLGKIAIVQVKDVPANTNQAVGIVRLKKEIVDVNYVYYYFSQNNINAYINKLSSQSSQPNLNLDLLGKLEFELRDIKDQQKIASVLSAIDSKIELNDKINAELEQMAKTLYDYWFVQFNFPDEKGRPYKTSGGKMVWCEELKREVPKDWVVKKISDLLPVLTGKQDANFATENGRYNFFTCGEEILKCDSFEFDGKAILLAGNGNFNIKLYEGKFNAYQRTYVLIPKNNDHYTLIYLAIKDRIKSLSSGSRGSIVKFITKGDIENITVVIPESGFSDLFNTLNTIIKKIESHIEQNQKLSELRDWLLPMLMNGQVKVD